VCRGPLAGRGFDARLAALLAAERSSEAWFRRVKVPEYFGAEVKLMLGESSRPDDSQQAQGNRWPLEYSMLGEVAHLELVRTPGSVSSFAIDSTVDGTT